ncbi:NADPH-dependent FMN reductase [Xanthovirga aplysinae]|uniref:NADPH-dependent FMN reductase n=1 Tax=Xanthovirga aplysinae TaxID=2529853 RepID=UPI0012BCFFAE|nr:NAD(P)H-dependent oxidoreductase [Xanthovirga aplysinae]MTI31838.1 NADPH-dependent oxidoreductase [Xanthovirga aplysinae]
MITIIIGTNRQDAVSKNIAHYYQGILKKKGADSQLLDLKELPKDFAFSALYENSGKNQKFNDFRTKVENSEKFVFIVPEYNGSFPGILKTFIDGLKYPDSFSQKKCALIGLSSGVQGAGLALSHLTDIFNYLGMHVFAIKPKLSQINDHFDGKEISNNLYNELLDQQAEGFIKF